jgi:hypothetical protein
VVRLIVFFVFVIVIAALATGTDMIASVEFLMVFDDIAIEHGALFKLRQ